jgi:hypothetical protein
MEAKPFDENFRIYTVQVFGIDEKGEIKRSRNWGYFLDKELAREVILQNVTDIYEAGYYNYALLNEIPQGICIGHKIKGTWYKADYHAEDIDDDGYIKLGSNPIIYECEKPIPKNWIIGLDC